MFKTLIGAAAVAVIAFVAYFFWHEWSAYDAQVRAENAKAAALIQYEIDTCTAAASNLRTVLSGGSLGFRFSQTDAKEQINICIAQGHLQKSEVADLL